MELNENFWSKDWVVIDQAALNAARQHFDFDTTHYCNGDMHKCKQNDDVIALSFLNGHKYGNPKYFSPNEE